MKINDNNIIKFSQDDIEVYSTHIDVADLIKFTVVDQYDYEKNPKGYQRPLNDRHVQQIADYLLVEDHAILPTAIILAIDKNPILKSGHYQFIDSFRIVDGQHRIAAMRKIIDDYTTDDDKVSINFFKSTRYPVIILILDKNIPIKRYVEIRTFVDINKKGRKVPTDLADTNINTILSELTELNFESALHRVIIGVAMSLDKNKASVWYNCIKMGDDNVEDKTIGISAFSKSIKPIARCFMIERFNKATLSTYTSDDVKLLIHELSNELCRVWEAVCEKWDYAFFYYEDNNYFRVDLDYSIQKGIGVYPIHKILYWEYKKTNSISLAITNFEKVLLDSNVISEDWKTGAKFSYFNSSSGFNKIASMIQNID